MSDERINFMGKDRITEEYRRHNILSTLHNGKYKGCVWKDKELLIEIEGSGIEAVLVGLRDFVDTRLAGI